jgi:amylosucrase
MALQWDALATQDTRVMLAAQYELLQKPYGASWITYTRCHDDIGLGYEDDMIRQAGYDPYQHRKFIKEYYSGTYNGSPARGALFSVNPKTQDARISGSLASLCGLEAALESGNGEEKELALRKIILMQAHSIFLGGIPMLFYGDELAYTNDYSYLDDEAKSYDNRWLHRPQINWQKNKRRLIQGTLEQRIFSDTTRLLRIRKCNAVFSDVKNLDWMQPYNIHVAGYVRFDKQTRMFLVFNFASQPSWLRWRALSSFGELPLQLFDHWTEKEILTGPDHEHLVLEPYQFAILEAGRGKET